MRATIAPPPPAAGSFRASHDHAAQCRHFASIMLNDPRLSGRVLDVGCGVNGPTIGHYFPVYKRPAQLDGLDPMPGVENNPWLQRAWHGEFEQCPIPENEYDAIVCINVVEHVADPEAFLRKALASLKPGGAIFATTPNGVHPFPLCVKMVQAIGLKSRMVAGKEGWNDYPAYYRLNTRAAVVRFGGQAGFDSAEFHYHPNMQWWGYWPKPLRFIPAGFDWMLGCRFRPVFQQLLWRLQRPGEWRGPTTGRTIAIKPVAAAR